MVRGAVFVSLLTLVAATTVEGLLAPPVTFTPRRLASLARQQQQPRRQPVDRFYLGTPVVVRAVSSKQREIHSTKTPSAFVAKNITGNSMDVSHQPQQASTTATHTAFQFTTTAAATIAAMLSMLLFPDTALASSTSAGVDPVSSALVAYAHYISMLLCTSATVMERSLVARELPLTAQEESALRRANIVYWCFLLGVLASGGARVVQYGKGWDFYAHEPIFWFKLALVGVWLSTSAFPTIMHIRRDLAKNPVTLQYYPMSDALKSRLQTIYLANLTALWSIPLAATMMARGVGGYWEGLPWQAGALVAAVPTVALSYKYVKEAVTWNEPKRVEGMD
jgi:putative membrane protein